MSLYTGFLYLPPGEFLIGLIVLTLSESLVSIYVSLSPNQTTKAFFVPKRQAF